MSGGIFAKNKKMMSHFCPSLESEHCSKTNPTNTELLPARQSGEEKWLNSHCYCPHPQPLQHSQRSPTTACRAGPVPCTCAEFAVSGIRIFGASFSLPASFAVLQWSSRTWKHLDLWMSWPSAAEMLTSCQGYSDSLRVCTTISLCACECAKR